MKRIRKDTLKKLMELSGKLNQEFSDPARQSYRIWRGDYRAIQWAAWWISESILEQEAELLKARPMTVPSIQERRRAR